MKSLVLPLQGHLTLDLIFIQRSQDVLSLKYLITSSETLFQNKVSTTCLEGQNKGGPIKDLSLWLCPESLCLPEALPPVSPLVSRNGVLQNHMGGHLCSLVRSHVNLLLLSAFSPPPCWLDRADEAVDDRDSADCEGGEVKKDSCHIITLGTVTNSQLS